MRKLLYAFLTLIILTVVKGFFSQNNKKSIINHQ